jgi:Leucine rich repeat
MSKNVSKYVKKGVLSQADYSFLAAFDPSKNQKYLNFIIKAYLADINLDLLRNRITEYDTLLSRNQVDRKDINFFKTFSQLDEYVQQHNNIRSTRELKREIKKQADIILDNADLFIVSPMSHEASCLYGASTRWCTTMANSVHWERYFYSRLVTFYYIQVRSETIKKDLDENSWKVGVAVYTNGKIEAYDAADHLIGTDGKDMEQATRLYNLLECLNLDSSLFIPRSMDERMPDYLSYKMQEGAEELNISNAGITKVPDVIGDMVQLKSLILSENKLQTLPESIGQLSSLKTLHLFHNQLNSLPESLYNLKGLQWLGLTGNSLSRKTIREVKRELPNTRIYIKDRKELLSPEMV